MDSRKLSHDEIDAIHAVVAEHGGYTKGLIPEMFAALAQQAQPSEAEERAYKKGCADTLRDLTPQAHEHGEGCGCEWGVDTAGRLVLGPAQQAQPEMATITQSQVESLKAPHDDKYEHAATWNAAIRAVLALFAPKVDERITGDGTSAWHSSLHNDR